MIATSRRMLSAYERGVTRIAMRLKSYIVMLIGLTTILNGNAQDIRPAPAQVGALAHDSEEQRNYVRKISALIKSNTAFHLPNDQVNNSPTINRIELSSDGLVKSIELIKSSTLPGFDEATRRAIERSQPFPQDQAGNMPPRLALTHWPYGVEIKPLFPQSTIERKAGTIPRSGIGVRIGEVTSELAQALGWSDNNGALIQAVEVDSPAEKAGIIPGDIIVRVNSQDVVRFVDFFEIIGPLAPGTAILVKLSRRGHLHDLSVQTRALRLQH